MITWTIFASEALRVYGPGTTAGDLLGFLPEILRPEDPRPASEQLADRYSHGGGYSPFGRDQWTLDLDTLVKLVEPYMPESLRARYSATERREIVAILQDSLDVLGDFPKRAAIFEPEVEYEPDTKTLLDSDSAKRVLGAMVTRLHAHGGPVTPESFKEMILSAGAEVALKGKDLYFPIRGAMTGSVHGPDLTRVAAVKGRDAVTRLLEGALK